MTQPRLLTYAEARAHVLGSVRPLPSVRTELANACGRALHRGAMSPHALPPFDNSSMDGFALRSADTREATPDHPVELPVVEVIPAGAIASRPLGPGEAMRIMTGAAMPEGADAVAPFEDTESVPGAGKRVRIPAPVAPGACIRRAGDDIAAHTEAVPEGQELTPHDIALLASLGIAHVDVGRRPRAAVVSTGDELLGVTEPLRPGAIRDGNRPMLEALLTQAGCEIVSSERLGDEPGEVAGRIARALGRADVVLSIGGVSAGDFDPVKQALHRLGNVELWRVAMKPGRPQAFGTPDGKLFFGLPGNPGSVACVFEALVRPALRKLQGYAVIDRPRLEVTAGEDIPSRPGRTDFVRVTLAREGGAWRALQAGAQISGHLTPQTHAHALLVVGEDVGVLRAGETAEALLLRWPE